MSDHSSSTRIPKHLIGYTEYVEFPDWDMPGVNAKVDTGARTSALHVEDVVPQDDGTVTFHVVLSRKYPHRRYEVCAPVVKWARVRSSTGHFTKRCFVRTRIRIGPVDKVIEVSLVSREKMIYRMLLGRKALEKDFLVDVSKRRALSKRPAKKRKKAVR